jgi:hypothetical protein
MIGMRMINPGPLVAMTRPSLKITPRSYSLRILMAEARKKTMKTIIRIKNVGMVPSFPHV